MDLVSPRELANNWLIFHNLPDEMPAMFSQFLLSTKLKITNISPPTTVEDLISSHYILTAEILGTLSNPLTSGNFQTKFRVAQTVISEINLQQDYINNLQTFTVMDPTVGSGVFLLVFVRYWIENPTFNSAVDLQLVGIDREIELLFIAWLSLTISQSLFEIDFRLNLFHIDILDIFHGLPHKIPRVNLMVGNPPWITWSDLPNEDRDKWKALSDKSEYEFIQTAGMDLSMGASNIDIGPLMFLLALDKFLVENSYFAFLFKAETINSSSLYWFRTELTPTVKKRKVRLTKILKFTSKSNFVNLEISTDCFIGKLGGSTPEFLTEITFQDPDEYDKQEITKLHKVQVSSPSDTFFLSKSKFFDTFLSIRQSQVKESVSSPEIRHGIKHDCKEVFEISTTTAMSLQWNCVYPTIKSRHIDKNGWNEAYDLVLVPNKSLREIDEQEFSIKFPGVYNYFLENKTRLEERKSRWLKSNAFYSIFGVGDYSFATYKVAWVRLGWKPYFSLIEPVILPNGIRTPVVPSDHFLFIPTENKEYGKYLVELLNSDEYRGVLDLLSSKKKSSLPKKLVSRLYIPTEKEFEDLRT